MATVLIVDDDKSIRELVREIVEMDGHNVLLATNGQEALGLCKEHHPDLVITDLIMPEKTGLDFIMEIKATKPNVPIIAISGGGGITGDVDYLPIAKLLGASLVISKPFDMKKLRAAITEALTATA